MCDAGRQQAAATGVTFCGKRRQIVETAAACLLPIIGSGRAAHFMSLADDLIRLTLLTEHENVLHEIVWEMQHPDGDFQTTQAKLDTLNTERNKIQNQLAALPS